jgi:hypothetical protein
MTNQELEEMERIAVDTKKSFVFIKHSCTWAWMDRDCEDSQDDWHVGFATRLEALQDAVEPYLQIVD